MAKDDFEQIREKVHQLVGEFFRDFRPLAYQPERSFHPPMDVYETEESLMVIMEIAGMKKEDFQVFIQEGLLSISGTRTEFAPSPKTRLHQMEIDYGYFERTLRIPFQVKAEEIKATYRDGFLIITVPKRSESVSKTVEVKLS
jgi:HSP20 family protein